MSFGIHRLWKDIFMERLGPTAGTNLLDMAGGTGFITILLICQFNLIYFLLGDITFRFLNYLKSTSQHNATLKSQVTVADINENMLLVGKQRAKDLCLDNLKFCQLNWAVANAENLQFENNSFTAYTIAFGIRNVTNIEKVLHEAYRVLQPGGRFLCLEFSHLENKALQW